MNGKLMVVKWVVIGMALMVSMYAMAGLSNWFVTWRL